MVSSLLGEGAFIVLIFNNDEAKREVVWSFAMFPLGMHCESMTLVICIEALVSLIGDDQI